MFECRQETILNEQLQANFFFDRSRVGLSGIDLTPSMKIVTPICSVRQTVIDVVAPFNFKTTEKVQDRIPHLEPRQPLIVLNSTFYFSSLFAYMATSPTRLRSFIYLFFLLGIGFPIHTKLGLNSPPELQNFIH